MQETSPAKFKPANKLEKLLIKAAKKPAARDKFYKELMGADVYAIPLNRPAIRGGMATDDKLHLMGYIHNDVFFIAFYSSEKRVEEANSVGTGFLKLKGADFFKLTRGSCLVLNPSSALGKEFTPPEVDGLLRQELNKNID